MITIELSSMRRLDVYYIPPRPLTTTVKSRLESITLSAEHNLVPYSIAKSHRRILPRGYALKLRYPEQLYMPAQNCARSLQYAGRYLKGFFSPVFLKNRFVQRIFLMGRVDREPLLIALIKFDSTSWEPVGFFFGARLGTKL
jgi:hypothetical protein